jgi:hypothetical protein
MSLIQHGGPSPAEALDSIAHHADELAAYRAATSEAQKTIVMQHMRLTLGAAAVEFIQARYDLDHVVDIAIGQRARMNRDGTLFFKNAEGREQLSPLDLKGLGISDADIATVRSLIADENAERAASVAAIEAQNAARAALIDDVAGQVGEGQSKGFADRFGSKVSDPGNRLREAFDSFGGSTKANTDRGRR